MLIDGMCFKCFEFSLGTFFGNKRKENPSTFICFSDLSKKQAYTHTPLNWKQEKQHIRRDRIWRVNQTATIFGSKFTTPKPLLLWVGVSDSHFSMWSWTFDVGTPAIHTDLRRVSFFTINIRLRGFIKYSIHPTQMNGDSLSGLLPCYGTILNFHT